MQNICINPLQVHVLNKYGYNPNTLTKQYCREIILELRALIRKLQKHLSYLKNNAKHPNQKRIIICQFEILMLSEYRDKRVC